jgi:twitching motility protein PilJ
MAEQKAGGGFTGGRRELTILILATALLIAALGSLYVTQTQATRNQAWLDLSREIATNSGRLTRVSRETTQGFEPDFRALNDTQVEFTELIQTLKSGDPDAGLPALPAEIQPDVTELETIWGEMQPSLTAVISNTEGYGRTSNNVAVIVNEIATTRALYDRITDALNERGQIGPALTASSQLVRLERLEAAARGMLRIGTEVGAAITEMQGLTRDFTRAQNQLSSGGFDATLNELIAQARAAFAPVAEAVEGISADTDLLTEFQTSGTGMLGVATTVVTAANTVQQAILDYTLENRVYVWPSYVLGIASVALLILFFVLNTTQVRRRAATAEERDERQQQAILGLLDEITNLADGDLTVDVTVTEDFTGAIADSLNYTVSNMRNLVGTINTTSAEITTSAANTAKIVQRMNEASERQAKEITAVTNQVVASAQSLQQVASRAEQLAQQAQNSVKIANSGSETVGRTIQGMTQLREQIQDTSKRIKRLGESSQEIGNIIEFINDISEQTNTLALNASIQAAMAGDAGRGFAVVADEVQRLAERAAQATRQIESLVKTIQADTNEAIISMERSTQNVVSGARSAEEAGGALTKIETSSEELSKLIQEISVSARNQSGTATKIAGQMQVIREIAVQTSGSAGQTAQAVTELNSLSEKLRASVSGFKLPGNA